MRYSVSLLVLLAVVSLGLGIAGCGSGSSEAPAPTDAGAPVASETQHDHDEAGGEHEAHDHASEGPHGGDLIVLGDEEYHAELLHDEATHTVAVHLLDAAGKEPVSSSQATITLQLFQNGQFVDHTLKAKDAGPAGASEYVLTDERVADTLLHGENVQGRLRVTIDGKEYIGTIKHEAHDHEGHDHEKEPHNEK